MKKNLLLCAVLMVLVFSSFTQEELITMEQLPNQSEKIEGIEMETYSENGLVIDKITIQGFTLLNKGSSVLISPPSGNYSRQTLNLKVVVQSDSPYNSSSYLHSLFSGHYNLYVRYDYQAFSNLLNGAEVEFPFHYKYEKGRALRIYDWTGQYKQFCCQGDE